METVTSEPSEEDLDLAHILQSVTDNISKEDDDILFRNDNEQSADSNDSEQSANKCTNVNERNANNDQSGEHEQYSDHDVTSDEDINCSDDDPLFESQHINLSYSEDEEMESLA